MWVCLYELVWLYVSMFVGLFVCVSMVACEHASWKGAMSW